MANYENIRDKGFDKRTTNELRVIASKGGKASGEARRKKANFRKTLNLLLSAKIENEELTPFLESLGIDMFHPQIQAEAAERRYRRNSRNRGPACRKQPIPERLVGNP